MLLRSPNFNKRRRRYGRALFVALWWFTVAFTLCLVLGCLIWPREFGALLCRLGILSPDFRP